MTRPMILDCTLRDGGYINQWRFGNQAIRNIISGLVASAVDIVECGFLRDRPYDPDCSVFSDPSQIVPLIEPKKPGVLYVAMIALGDIAPEKVPPCDGSSIDGIRLTFHKHEWKEAKETALALMDKGYRVFVQPVGTTAYSDRELLDLLAEVNRIHPYAFYLVDTLGVLYRRDLLRMFYLTDNNLASDIRLGFHSHNNLQLSFAHAQELFRVDSKREIILDSSVYGMGRGAGNLSTELIAQYINENRGQRYNLMPLLSIADRYLMSIYAEQRWGYDLPYFLSAAANCHPNYAAYLLKKETLSLEDISRSLDLLPEDQKDLYHPELIEEIYKSLQDRRIDDAEALEKLEKTLKGREVLLLGSARSIKQMAGDIEAYRAEKKPLVIAVNFLPDDMAVDGLFISNRKRFQSLGEGISQCPCVVATSNLELKQELLGQVTLVDYSSYLGEGAAADNAGAMVIRLLRRAGVAHIALAGFDGFSVDSADNYCVDFYRVVMERREVDRRNSAIARQLKLALGDLPHRFITPTRYEIS